MCGNEVDEKSGFSWRGDCHTDDDVPGGYHDCGDHVKFGITAGYSTSTLGWSYREYKDVFDSLGQTGHLKLITDHFCKYFKDCTTLSGGSVTDFVYQIGDGDADHNTYWGPPEQQDKSSRKTFRTSSGASDVAAEYAAALAVNYLNFGKDEDLEYAKALFEFSTKYNQVATQGVTPFYSSTACEDDQSFAAGFLYLATNDDKYNSFLKNHQKDPNYEHCWDNVYLGAAVLNGEINGDWSIPTKYADQRMQNPNSWYTPDGWGAARYNTSAQFIGMLLKKHGKADHTAWCKGQMDMILGKNPKNVCLVVGFNNVSAKYPHHEAASGLKGWDEYNAAGATFGGKGHTLTGALEGGFSNTSFQYVDALNDITSSEVGIDYNATLVAAAAALYDEFETGQVDPTPNGVDRNIQYENPTPVTTTTTTATESTTTTTTTTTAARAKRIVHVSILDPETGKQVPGVEYAIEGYGDNGAFFGTQKFTSGDTTDVVDVNYHDLTEENLKGAMFWKLILNDVPKKYLVPRSYTDSILFDSNGEANISVTLDLMPDMSKLTFELTLVDKETGAYIPGATFVVSGTEGDKDLGEKVYTSVDGVNSIDCTWDGISDPTRTSWKATILTLPDGYKLPDRPQTIYVFQTLNTVKKTYEIEKDDSVVTYKVNVLFKDKESGAAVSDVPFQILVFNGGAMHIAKDQLTSGSQPLPVEITYGTNVNLTYCHWAVQPTSVPYSYKQPQYDLLSGTLCFEFDENKTADVAIELERKPLSEHNWGDANLDGKVTVADAVAILQSIANKDKYALKPQGATNADVYNNGDGVTAKDALIIQMIDAGKYTVYDLPISDIKEN